MQITEVRIKLTEDSDDRLQAFCSVTFDDAFVVRDLKIIEGTNGPFVAMPSRKLTAHCPRCGCKNHLRANYCNHCGTKLDAGRAVRDVEGRAKLYADIAHPIHSQCREAIQERVIAEYRRELELAKQPGYVSRYEDDYELDDYPLEPPATSGRVVRHDRGHLDEVPPVSSSPTAAAAAAAEPGLPGLAVNAEVTGGGQSPAEVSSAVLPRSEKLGDTGERSRFVRADEPTELERKLEPPSSATRAPHQAPREPATARPAVVPAPKSIQTSDRKPTSGFGAGILDEA